jgi:hypothetical protein
VWVVSLLGTAAILSSAYPQLRQYLEDYPATSEARERLERYSAVVATTSPLSADQSTALLTTLAAEHRRRRAEEDVFSFRHDDRYGYLEAEEQRLVARNESNRRIIESAKGYLDAQQLAAIEEAMAQYSTRAQAALQARRERLAPQDLELEIRGTTAPQ